MLEQIFSRAVPTTGQTKSRDEGAAFLNVTCSLYGFKGIDYLAFNVPGTTWKKRYMHFRHANDALTHSLSDTPADPAVLEALEWTRLKQGGLVSLSEWPAAGDVAGTVDGVAFGLRTLGNEIALAIISWPKDDTSAQTVHSTTARTTAVRDTRLLMNYFHSHLLRINGINSDDGIVMSARELDCLSWTAAGKTAWEASIILGISERTVRFHLNVAREKLRCATTTQAVAKAINNHLIDVPA